MSVTFYELIQPLLPETGEVVRFGNVDFWIDATGPWAGIVSSSLPGKQWDTPAIVGDVAKRLMAEGRIL